MYWSLDEENNITIYAKRCQQNPIITPETGYGIGSNINGPSLIKVPDWLPNPLGNYYLYFSHHRGTYIRMAYADRIEGLWQGTVSYPGLDLRVVFKISRRPTESLTAVMIQPDQGDHENPVSSLTFVDGHLHMEVSASGVCFDGRLTRDGYTI